MIRAIIGLGSSLGDRARLLKLASAILAASPGVTLRAASRLYESPPSGGTANQPFLNAAVLLDYDGTPEELLALCLAVEGRLGRRRVIRWADRTVDLDLLWVEGTHRTSASLTVPHPRLEERAFALHPLLDLNPDARDPSEGHLYREKAARLPGVSAVGVLAPGLISGYPRASAERHSAEEPGHP